MIKGQEVFKYIDPKANFLAKDESGEVYWYEGRPQKYNCYNWWYYSGKNNSGYLGEIQIEEFAGKDWSECILEKEQDTKDWIGCLCWFWDDDEKIKRVGILAKIKDYGEYLYKTDNDDSICRSYNAKHCRPVKKSEVKFFEE